MFSFSSFILRVCLTPTTLLTRNTLQSFLIFILKFGWPKIRDFFNDGMEDLGGAREDLVSGSTGSNP